MRKTTKYVRRYLGITGLEQELGSLKAMQIKYRDRDGRQFARLAESVSAIVEREEQRAEGEQKIRKRMTRMEAALSEFSSSSTQSVAAQERLLEALAERDKQRADAEQETRKRVARVEAALAELSARMAESVSAQKLLLEALAERDKRHDEEMRASRKQIGRVEAAVAALSTKAAESATEQRRLHDAVMQWDKQLAGTVEVNHKNLAKRLEALGRGLQQILTANIPEQAERDRQYADTAAAIEDEIAELRSWALARFAGYHKEMIKRVDFLERALKNDVVERERQHDALMDLNRAIDAFRSEASDGQQRLITKRLDALKQQVEAHLSQRATLDRRQLEWTVKAARMVGDMRAGVGILIGTVPLTDSDRESEAGGSGTEYNGSANARKLLPGHGRSQRNTIVIASYGVFDSNSAGHIAGFGNGLVRLGYRVVVCGSGRITSAYSFGEPAFEFFRIQDLAADPKRVIGFNGRFCPEETLILCWTPREIVRRTVEPIAQLYGIPYVVHLEDNEQHIASIPDERKSSDPLREGFADPSKLPAFLAGAAGLTVIEERLVETLPGSVPSLLLEPGVDHAELGSRLRPLRRATIRGGIGVSKSATMIVYPGNVHRANVEDVRQLYEAVELLRRGGRNVVLVRTGNDFVQSVGFLEKARPEVGVITLGQVERPFLVDLLKSADLFVQPGQPGPFNDYRLPSKIPEFMAVGRPIILPFANVGTRLRDGVDALLLREGSAAEIAGQIERVLSEPGLAARLSTNARAFARRHYQWDTQVKKLANFLAQTA